jgi:hypothetical protein
MRKEPVMKKVRWVGLDVPCGHDCGSARRAERRGAIRPGRLIRILLDAVPLLEHGCVLRGDEEVTMLGSGAEATFMIPVVQGIQHVVHVRIEWSDDPGHGKVRESQLKVI